MKARTGLLIILDGFGINSNAEFNAVENAKMPVYRRLWQKYPHSQIQASESFVGLPKGFMGNSEVGHLNIGAGRVVFQDFSLISRAIDDGEFFKNQAFLELIGRMKKEKKVGALHLMGLVSDGGVHSHLSHLYALIQLAKQQKIQKVYIHVFTDGRDTSPTSGVGFVKELTSFCTDAGLGKIATVSGRFFAMDRDNRWDRVEQAYQAIVQAKAGSSFTSAEGYLRKCYDENTTDEFIPPACSKDYSGIQDGDGVIFFNFRADRAREISRAMTQSDFSSFKREKFPLLAGFVCMTPYDESLQLPTAFEKPKVKNTLGDIISQQGWKQLRIAETEKYAHVTYFFNGGDEKVFPGEKRVLVPSPREVKTYDLKPEMSAYQVTDQLLNELKTKEYQFAVVNFANPDMVGHTGNFPSAVKAVEAVDQCLGKIVDWVESNDAFAILTADHGNCEKMQADDGTPLTSHTLLPVPFIVINGGNAVSKVADGGQLCDIAPTMMDLWKLPKPKEMTGRSLI